MDDEGRGIIALYGTSAGDVTEERLHGLFRQFDKERVIFRIFNSKREFSKLCARVLEKYKYKYVFIEVNTNLPHNLPRSMDAAERLLVQADRLIAKRLEQTNRAIRLANLYGIPILMLKSLRNKKE